MLIVTQAAGADVHHHGTGIIDLLRGDEVAERAVDLWIFSAHRLHLQRPLRSQHGMQLDSAAVLDGSINSTIISFRAAKQNASGNNIVERSGLLATGTCIYFSPSRPDRAHDLRCGSSTAGRDMPQCPPLESMSPCLRQMRRKLRACSQCCVHVTHDKQLEHMAQAMDRSRPQGTTMCPTRLVYSCTYRAAIFEVLRSSEASSHSVELSVLVRPPHPGKLMLQHL